MPTCAKCGKDMCSLLRLDLDDAAKAFMGEIVCDSCQKREHVDTANRASQYGTARFIGELIAALGWLLFTAGVILAIVFMVQDRGWPALLPALYCLLSGMFLVMNGQLVCALVDGVNNSAEIVSLLRKIAEK